MKAIFLGSFNPPHTGHKNCINTVIDYIKNYNMNIDSIHIIPCWQNPNKEKSIDYWHRYNMCRLEFSNLEVMNKGINIFVDDIENEIRPKYTVDLIKHFKSNKDKYIDETFWWIITEETYNELLQNKWKESQWLLENNNFLYVFTDKIPSEQISKGFIPLLLHGSMDVHSTQIREKVKNNESLNGYVNLGVETYIKTNNLYK